VSAYRDRSGRYRDRTGLDVLEFYGFATFCISLPFVLAYAIGLAQSFE